MFNFILQIIMAAPIFTPRIPYKPFEYPEYYTEGWLKQAQAFGYIPKYL